MLARRPSREDAAVCENRLARGLVVRLAGDEDPTHAGAAGDGQDSPQRFGGVPAPALPGHDRVADMTRAVRRQFLRPRLMAKADDAAELAVADPEFSKWQARHDAAVTERHRAVLLVLVGEEALGIGTQPRQLFGAHVAQIVRGPARLERL